MSFQKLAEELLERTGASRTTVRIDDEPGVEFPVKAQPPPGSTRSPATESCRARVARSSVDPALLVQEDLLGVDPAPAPELIERYGARAQMLAPVQRGGELVGLVSVHYAPGPRRWTDSEIASLQEIVARGRAGARLSRSPGSPYLRRACGSGALRDSQPHPVDRVSRGDVERRPARPAEGHVGGWLRAIPIVPRCSPSGEMTHTPPGPGAVEVADLVALHAVGNAVLEGSSAPVP